MEGQEKKFDKIQILLRDISERYRKEGIPVDNNCRVNLEKLKEYFPGEKTNQDLEKVKDLKERIGKEGGEDKRKYGERLERMKTVVLNKFLEKYAVVIRTSEYDDIINGVDNILVDREDGKIICAFDEVCDTNSEIFQKKREKILRRNEEGGARLKYCPKIKEDKFSIESVENIPIFYLALNEEILRGAEKKISSFFKEVSLYEEKLFKYFWNSLYNQAEFLYLDPKVNDEILNNLSFFEKIPPPK